MYLIQCIQPYHLASRRAARHFETKSPRAILSSARANLSKWKLNILFVRKIGKNISKSGEARRFDISKRLEFQKKKFTSLKYQKKSVHIIRKEQSISSLIFRLAKKNSTDLL